MSENKALPVFQRGETGVTHSSSFCFSLSVSLYHTSPSLFLYITRFKAQVVACGKCLIANSFLSALPFRLYNPNPETLPCLSWSNPRLWQCTHSSQWPGLAWHLLRQLRWQLYTRTCPTARVWSPRSPGTPPHLQTLCLVGQKNTEGGSVRLLDLGNCYGGAITTWSLQTSNSHEPFKSYFWSCTSKIAVFHLIMENWKSGRQHTKWYNT